MKHGLTLQQSKLLDFIRVQAALDVSPTYEMMMEHMGLKTKSNIHRLVVALSERGHIHRLAGKARSIVLADEYGGICAICREALSRSRAA